MLFFTFVSFSFSFSFPFESRHLRSWGWVNAREKSESESERERKLERERDYKNNKKNVDGPPAEFSCLTRSEKCFSKHSDCSKTDARARKERERERENGSGTREVTGCMIRKKEKLTRRKKLVSGKEKRDEKTKYKWYRSPRIVVRTTKRFDWVESFRTTLFLFVYCGVVVCVCLIFVEISFFFFPLRSFWPLRNKP